MRFTLLALAAPAAADLRVLWQNAKASGQTALSVFDGAALVAQACGSSMLAGTPQGLDFSDLDANGFGNITVGGAKYLAHADPAYSGGPVCSKKYNDAVAVVECTGLGWALPAGAPLAADCHGAEDAAVQDTISFFTAADRVPAASALVARGVDSADGTFNTTVAGCGIITTAGLVGDGNPHQNFYDKQLSENIYCGSAPSCSVGHSESKSFSIGWSSTGSPASWISGGFAVQESWTTGNDYHCSAGSGETVCVWYNTAHTAYTVRNAQLNTCENQHTWEPYGNNFIIFSPNKQNRNGGYYCVVGTCRAQGDAYWDYNGRAGGP